MTGTGDGSGAVVVLTYKQARVFDSDRVGTPERDIASQDLIDARLNMHHRAGGITGYYQELPDEYWQQVADAVRAAPRVLLVGHGTGKSNAVLQFCRYLARTDPSLLDRVVGGVDTDVEDLTGPQVLELARDFYGEPARRRLPRTG